MKSEIYEKAVLVKLFHNSELREKYLPDLILGLFYDRDRRILAFIMKELFERKLLISVENLVIAQNNRIVKAFAAKHKIPLPLSEDKISNIVFDVGVDGSPNLFEDAYHNLHDEAFAYYVENSITDFTYDLGYKNRSGIIAKAKAIQKVHDIIFSSKLKQRVNQIDSAFEEVNKGSGYLRMSSNKITSLVGGWSKGFVGSAIGRPSHNKSTWFTYDSTWQVNHNGLPEVHVIGSEETPTAFWRRIFGIELSVPIRSLIEGDIKLSNEDLKRIKEKYEGKIMFHPLRYLDDITDLMNSLNGVPYIWIDHINSIIYPKDDMYSGIITLVNRQKQWLDKNPQSVVVDLSQVNTKKMKQSGRLFPHKEDAYMSSILEQASREFLSFYYPYKDSIDPEVANHFRGKGHLCKQDLIQVSIEKSSYGDVGVTDLSYEYKFGRFGDTTALTGMDMLLGKGKPQLDFNLPEIAE